MDNVCCLGCFQGPQGAVRGALLVFFSSSSFIFNPLFLALTLFLFFFFCNLLFCLHVVFFSCSYPSFEAGGSIYFCYGWKKTPLWMEINSRDSGQELENDWIPTLSSIQ